VGSHDVNAARSGTIMYIMCSSTFTNTQSLVFSIDSISRSPRSSILFHLSPIV
jgi:hypothetical protein